ncbi:gliding motility protein [Nonlabens dokdonensis DSW-6]|uniref:Gliding motility protein n=2 Tax=Nonlabens dokdonensis TaxID=328515 RepID=L7W777_NONDD|nr:gliding motility protein [Nonlabens dokdonensis DSW-6]
MYLVFIAMLALNMSKEVLTAFGLLNVNIEESNAAATAKNNAAMAGLTQLASEQPKQYGDAKLKGEKVDQISKEYFNYLEGLKNEMEGTVDDSEDYAVMDKGDFLDVKFLKGGKITPEGQEFLDRMTGYRDAIKETIPNNTGLANELDEKFTPEPVENRDGVMVPYLDYNYKGYPLIASIAKVTLLQSEVKNIETQVLAGLISSEQASALSVTKLTTLLEQPKSAYYNGETFDGSIVLGKKDPTFKPKRVELKLDGRNLTQGKDFEISEGRIDLKVGAGSPGDHKITGALIFEEGGKEESITVEQSFATIPKPNSATIAADKMNVVYRGVPNPMTISFAGVSGNNVNASAPGLTRKSGDSYVMNPGSGTSVKINVTAKLSTGESVSDSKEFRIKNLPRPTGMVSKAYENVRKTRSNLAISTVSAEFLDFDFDLTPRVTGFLFKVPGQPSVPVTGTKLSGTAVNVLNKARKGDLVQFANIKAVLPGVNVKSVSDVTVEITD